MSKKYYDRILTGSGFSNKVVKSDFAEAAMKKMGWQEGQGLGANAEGTLVPVQIKRREENLGLGEEGKKGEDEWKNWWDGVYNKIASKIVAPSKSAEESDDSSDESENELGNAGKTGRRAKQQQGKLRRVNAITAKPVQFKFVPVTESSDESSITFKTRAQRKSVV